MQETLFLKFIKGHMVQYLMVVPQGQCCHEIVDVSTWIVIHAQISHPHYLASGGLHPDTDLSQDSTCT